MLVPVIDMKKIGQKINTLRIRRGFSVRDLQRMLGIATPQAIYKWQRGETLPSVDNLVALACALEVSMDETLEVDCRKTGKEAG